MVIDTLDKLHDSGELEKLCRSGLISVNVIVWRKIYHAYHQQLEMKVSSAQAITNVAEVFGVGDRAVYRTIKRLKG